VTRLNVLMWDTSGHSAFSIPCTAFKVFIKWPLLSCASLLHIETKSKGAGAGAAQGEVGREEPADCKWTDILPQPRFRVSTS
jgi:hypothetical protein